MFVNNWPRTWIWTHNIKIKLALQTVFEYFVENLIYIYLKNMVIYVMPLLSLTSSRKISKG